MSVQPCEQEGGILSYDQAIMGRRKISKSKYTLSKFTELKYTSFKWHAVVLVIMCHFHEISKTNCYLSYNKDVCIT